MDCCQCQLIETQFDREAVESKVRRYHEKGPKKETVILIEALLSEGVEGSSILDMGGGLGVLEFELIKHPTKEVDRLVKEAGLRVLFQRELIDWQIVVYGR
jgi:magnesium-protoporphyrin O-methyltransferase